MRRVSCVVLFTALAGLVACEDGPDQVYKPNPANTDFSRYNGWKPKAFVAEGTQPFAVATSGQKSGTTKICEADELAKRWTAMVKQPIEPTKGAGGLNLKGVPEWSGLTVDAAQQQLCQAYVYDVGMVYWGDNAEMIAFFDEQTRLINRLVTLTGYEGTITADDFEIANNKPIQRAGKQLTNPWSDQNVRELNVALLKKFRKEVANPEARDCIALSTCYVMDWYTLKRFVFNDLMLDFAIEPQGERIDHIAINLKRSFDFEKADVKFEGPPMPATGLPPFPRIDSSASCKPQLGLTWDHIKSNCLGIDPEAKALTQPVWSNEALMADMGGLGVYMTRPSLAADKTITPGEKAQPTDEIVGFSFDSTYEGLLVVPSGELYKAFWATVISETQKVVPAAVDVVTPLTPALAKLSPKGTVTKLAMGTQKISDCAKLPCVDATLTIRTREIVTAQVQKVAGSVPDTLKDPNFYVEIFLRELLKIFNEGKAPSAADVYFWVSDDSAQIMQGSLARIIGGQRYAVRLAFHNKSDQLMYIFFRRGQLRTEAVLYKDAELPKADKSAGDGVFRLWNLVTSPRIGLGKKIFPKTVFEATRKALVTVALDQSTDVLVAYHKEDSLSGYSIPLEGKRDMFYPAAYYGFSGNVIGAAIWASGKDGIIKAASSGSFYDKLDFCGAKVGLWDSAPAMISTLPKTCDYIISYSENGKLLTAISTYVQQTPFKIGLRLFFTAGRIDSAYYWAEQ